VVRLAPLSPQLTLSIAVQKAELRREYLQQAQPDKGTKQNNISLKRFKGLCGY